jgi:hypothetical protein
MKIIRESCTTQIGASLEQYKTQIGGNVEISNHQAPISHIKLPVSSDPGAAYELVIWLSGIVP